MGASAEQTNHNKYWIINPGNLENDVVYNNYLTGLKSKTKRVCIRIAFISVRKKVEKEWQKQGKKPDCF